MNKLIIILGLISLIMPGCSTQTGNQNAGKDPKASELIDHHNSRNALDWQGVYKGVTPCADCEGIETTIVLKSDNTFTRTLSYLGKEAGEFADAGTFEWNEAGSAITLIGKDGSRQMYQVGENVLFHLDKEGNRISGDLAEKYMLTKNLSDSRLEGKKWVLDALKGKKMEPKNNERVPFIQFDAAKSSCSGNSSCNNFFGSYELLADNGIKFGNLAATKMACPDNDTEQLFFEMLAETVSYQVDESRLILLDADLKEIALFTVAQD